MSVSQLQRRVEIPSFDVPSFGHLQVMTGPRGLYEHSLYSRPRLEHGYSLDDNARALVAMSRAVAIGMDVPTDIGQRCLRFVLRAGAKDSWSDRQSSDGTWQMGATDDAIGRAMWGLGAAAGYWPDPEQRLRARRLLDRSHVKSGFWRPNAYAILGLTALHRIEPDNELLPRIRYHTNRLPPVRWKNPSWPWPEPVLTYDNARLPEVMMAAGVCLGDEKMVEEGLALLSWLIELEASTDHFSFTPVSGRRQGDPQGRFDQQPIEAWAMVDASCRAASVSEDASWFGWAELGLSWFMGNNDTGHCLYDSVSGGCYDGLTPTGPNLNRGAESTIAAMASRLATIKGPDSP
jgi:hypothetical protein